MQAARNGHQLDIWSIGLVPVDLHLKRVAQRLAGGGHSIPEAAIRQRWFGSHENIIRLIPFVTTLRVFDNSAEADEPGFQPSGYCTIQRPRALPQAGMAAGLWP
jgi:predicted ABC-type ATPase